MDQTKMLDRLRRQCSKREYCESDIRKKIRTEEQKSGILLGSDEIVASLKSDRYLSDTRYAEAFARDKSSLDGWGPLKIRFSLQAKGICAEDITAALSSVDVKSASSRLEKLIASRYKSLVDDPQCRLKLLRYALGRGYGYEEVSSIVEKVVKQRDV